MESVPVRLELQDPAYGMVFRGDGLHVYLLEDNSPDPEKSAAFTRALTDAGFAFPASLSSGNPTHRKEFDEGYLLTDAEGRLYQLKMVDGQPEVRHFPAADTLALTYISIVEVSDHSVLGYLSDTDGYVRPRVRDFSWVGLAVDLVLLAGVWALRRRRNPQK